MIELITAAVLVTKTAATIVIPTIVVEKTAKFTAKKITKKIKKKL